jgi:LacI family transcriptional regulator
MGAGDANRFGNVRAATRHRSTLCEVAARAGVSPTTVSHALSGKRPVAASTRQSIERAARELHYRPNAVARSLRTRRSYTAGLIVPDISNPIYPRLARGLQDELASAGCHVLVCNTDRRADDELEYLVDVLDRQVDGVVIVAFHLSNSDLAQVPLADVPLVSIGSRLDHPSVDVVRTDDRAGARDATRHLLGLGHSVGLIGGPANLPPSESRGAGYREALTEAGAAFRPEFVVNGDFTRAGGAAAMRAIATPPDHPTAIFCANDLMAIGAMDVARELGWDVPRDVALAGYDDIAAAALVTPALTTVHIPADQLGATAGRLLRDRMDGYAGPRRQVVISHEFVQRDSA